MLNYNKKNSALLNALTVSFLRIANIDCFVKSNTIFVNKAHLLKEKLKPIKKVLKSRMNKVLKYVLLVENNKKDAPKNS